MCSLKTLFTGIAPGVKGLGLLLDPLNLSGAVGPKPASAPAPPDPAAERAAAEAEAAQKANRQIAEDSRRRRQQGSLLAQGASSAPSLGDSSSTDGLNPIGSTAPRVSRSPLSPARLRASLMSAGASPAAAAPSPLSGVGGGGGGGGSRTFVQAY